MNKTSNKAALAGAILSLSLALTGCATGSSDAAHQDTTHSEQSLPEAAAFAQAMIPHHLQAITMAAYAKDNAKDPQVVELAKQIYTGQAAEVETMKAWLGGAELQDHSMIEGMLSEEQMASLAATKGADFDQLFLESMKAHHEGALAMATKYQKSEDAELKKLVTSILQVQTIELSMIKILANK